MSMWAAERAEGFRTNNEGAVAVLFALMLVPLIVLVGAGIDYGRGVNLKTTAQAATDAAVIAGARALMQSGQADKAVEAAEKSFAASSASRAGVMLNVTVDEDDGKVSAVTSGTVSTTFMALVGVMTFDVSAQSSAVAPKAAAAGRSGEKTGKGAAGGLGNMSASDIAELVSRVEAFCQQLWSLGVGGQVKACQQVDAGTFEDELRTHIASNGNAEGAMPAGIRLTQ